MSSKTKFTASIIVLTVLLIGFFTVTVLMTMFLFIKGFSVTRLGFLIIAFGFAIILIRKMIRLNERGIKSNVENVLK